MKEYKLEICNNMYGNMMCFFLVCFAFVIQTLRLRGEEESFQNFP